MSVGGIITKIIENSDGYLIEVTDKKDVQWRSLDKNDLTKCVGTGDAIWWQCHQAFWTPSALNKSWEGEDIKIGKCYEVRNPLCGLLKREDHSNDDLDLPYTY